MNGYSAFAQYYDALTENVTYALRAEYLLGLFRRFGCEPKLMLDLACGTGSMAAEFAARGVEVIAVDASPDMLCEAREKVDGLPVLLLCQEMTELDLYGTVDSAICTLDSINHLTEERDVCRALKQVSLFLEPGGIFIFDVNTLYKHREVLGNNTFVYDLPEVYCVWQCSCGENDTVAVELDFFEPDGERYIRSQESFYERAYSPEQLEKWIVDAGMETLAVYEEMSERPVGEKTQRAVYIVRKSR